MENTETKIDFLYLNEPDMLEAGVMDVGKCVDVLSEVMCLLEDGDYLEGGPNGNSHGIMMSFPKESDIKDFPLNDIRDRRFMAMPAYLGGRFHLMGMKWYGSNPRNKAKGLPRSILTVMLNDVETGAPIAHMSANVLSAVRTGAMPGMAAKYLARKGSEVLSAIGAGVISKTSLLAVLSQVPTIKTVKIKGSSPTSRTAHDLADYIKEHFPHLEVTICANLQETIENSDIIVESVTVGKPEEWPRIETSWVKQGATFISSSCLCFDKNFLANDVHKVVDNIKMYEGYLANRKEYLAAHPEEAEKRHPSSCVGMAFMDLLEENLCTKKDIYNIGSIIEGKSPGRTSDDEIFVIGFDGMPILDVAWGYTCYQEALKKKIGTSLTLWENPYLK